MQSIAGLSWPGLTRLIIRFLADNFAILYIAGVQDAQIMRSRYRIRLSNFAAIMLILLDSTLLFLQSRKERKDTVCGIIKRLITSID